MKSLSEVLGFAPEREEAAAEAEGVFTDPSTHWTPPDPGLDLNEGERPRSDEELAALDPLEEPEPGRDPAEAGEAVSVRLLRTQGPALFGAVLRSLDREADYPVVRGLGLVAGAVLWSGQLLARVLAGGEVASDGS